MKKTENHEYDIPRMISEKRKSLGLTQVQISQKTGIAQCDISRIESGRANPSIKTLKRLAEGMGMNVKLEFVPANSK